MLAVCNVLCCALVWKLCSWPNTLKAPRVFQLLFVQFLHRIFWLQLLKRCCCSFYSSSDKLRQPIKYADIDRLEDKLTEHLRHPIRQDTLGNGRLEEVTQNCLKTHEAITQKVIMLGDKPIDKAEELETWAAVASGINKVVERFTCLAMLLYLLVSCAPSSTESLTI